MEKKNVEQVAQDIIRSLEEAGVVKPGNLQAAKLVLDMHLSKYQLITEETALSTDCEHTYAYLERYLMDMRLRGCTENSIRSYQGDLKNFLAYVDRPVPDILYHDIQRYLSHGKLQRGWNDRTYNTKLIQIRSFFKYLYEEDLIRDNPGKKLHEARVERRIGPTVTAYQREEIRCACANEREQALCDMLYSTGARISELCALNISDIDFTSMSAIVYGKGRKEREIYFNAPAKLHLLRYLQTRTDSNPALFVTTRKPYSRMTPDTARLALKRIQARDSEIAGIKLTPHVFRRSVGTDMINRGAPLEVVAEKLGHVQLDTTKQCYAAISRETVRQAHNRYV